jgi:branched-chain amino acid transport system permease protein
MGTLDWRPRATVQQPSLLRPALINQHAAVFVLIAAGGLAAPFMFYPAFIAKLLCFAIFAMAFNLLVGQAGLLSFGHAMFFGGASYVTGYTLKALAFPTELAIVAGVAFAALLGLVVGLVAIRRQGIYFAMITLALAQMFFYLCAGVPFTGGDDGISAIPHPPILQLIDINNDRMLYYLVFAGSFATYALIFRITHSPFGQVMRAIRDNEARAISLGYKVNRYKLLTFVLSATIAGLAGALKVLVFRLASLADVSWTTSGDVILMTLAGGVGTLLGPIVGSAFVLTMQSLLQPYSQWIPVLQGAVFILLVLLLPRGIIGELIHRWPARLRGKRFTAQDVDE